MIQRSPGIAWPVLSRLLSADSYVYSMLHFYFAVHTGRQLCILYLTLYIIHTYYASCKPFASLQMLTLLSSNKRLSTQLLPPTFCLWMAWSTSATRGHSASPMLLRNVTSPTRWTNAGSRDSLASVATRPRGVALCLVTTLQMMFPCRLMVATMTPTHRFTLHTLLQLRSVAGMTMTKTTRPCCRSLLPWPTAGSHRSAKEDTHHMTASCQKEPKFSTSVTGLWCMGSMKDKYCTLHCW